MQCIHIILIHIEYISQQVSGFLCYQYGSFVFIEFALGKETEVFMPEQNIRNWCRTKGKSD